MYEDRAELILIFPDVKKGSVIESIILVEHPNGFRIPGEYMSHISWKTSIWPSSQKRILVDLPEFVASRLNFSKLGSAIPPRTEKKIPGKKRVVYTWEENNSPRSIYTRNAPPNRQVGPSSLLTTWKSWDDLAKWYQDLIKDRQKLSPNLLKMLSSQTAKAKTEDEIIDALYHQVANEVRYVGLEFGIAGLQPYSCEDVWKNKYGDCKDKSNLLVALLNAKRIEAYIALVDTKHDGRINTRHPSYQPFNHAIVAVSSPASTTGWRFLDPTINRAPTGTLGPWSAGRDVLILKGNEAVWAKTPKSSAGNLHFTFELKLEAAGRLSGWMNFDTEGYYASSYADSFLGHGKEGKVDEAQEIVASFFPKAQVIDVEHDVIKDSHEKFHLKAFFDAPFPFPTSASEPVRISFPNTGRFLPWLGNERNRKEPWYIWQDYNKVTLNIEIPDGWSPGRLPQSIKLDSDTLEAKGEWKIGKKGITGVFDVQVKESRLSTSKFASTFNAITSLSSWLKRNAEFIPGEGALEPVKAEDLSAIEMPIMPSGSGQLKLVNTRFPIRNGIPQRRLALKKLLQYFPNDATTQFETQVQLAYLDYLKDKNAEAVASYTSILKKFDGEIDVTNEGYARYLRGLALIDMDSKKSKADGIREMITLSQDSKLPEYRRSWAAYQAAFTLNKNEDPKRSSELLEQHLEFDDEHFLIAAYSTFSETLLKQNQVAKLKAKLKSLVDDQHPAAPRIFEKLAKDSTDQLDQTTAPGDPARASLQQLLESLELQGLRSSSPELETALSTLEQRLKTRGSLKKIHTELLTLLDSPDLPEWISKGKVPEGLKNAKAHAKKLEEVDGDGSHNFVPTAVAYFKKYPPQSDLPRFLWRFLAYTEWNERPANTKDSPKARQLFEDLLAIAVQLPKTDDYYWESRFVKGTWLQHRSQFREEGQEYLSMLNDKEMDPDYLVSASFRGGRGFEKSGDLEKAESIYLRCRESAPNVVMAINAMTRAALIRLELGNQDGALKLFNEMQKIKPSMIEESDYGEIARLLLLLTKDQAKARAYWNHTEKWWPKWIDMCQSLPAVGEFKAAPLVGLIDDQDIYSQDLNQGVEKKDGKRFLKAYNLLAHQARWVPDALNEFARISLYGSIPLQPAKGVEWRAFIAGIYDGVEPADREEMGAFLLYYLIALTGS